MGKIELMSPAGSFEALQAALDGGADSVYFGISQLNMRAVSSINFTLEDLAEIVERCKKYNIKSYLTLNTIIYDHDLTLVNKILSEAKKNDISAVIASDHAVMAMAKQLGIDVHISTQANVTNIETVKFYSLFANTMVLSRELSLTQIEKICSQIEKENILAPNGELVKVEIFGHGALCMAVSGKCYLSLHSYNSSANRGACKQNCRKKYTVKDEDGVEFEIDNEYIMSPQDLCTLDFLDKVIDSGVKVLKLEGRGRSADYVKATTKCYREAIDAYYNGEYTKEKVAQWLTRLKEVYNRGFWAGYYLGQEMGEWTKEHPSSQSTNKKLYIAQALHYYPKAKIAQFKMEAYDLAIGDRIMVIGPTTGVQESEISDLMIEDTKASKAKKGDNITIPLDFRIRTSDKLYKIVNA